MAANDETIERLEDLLSKLTDVNHDLSELQSESDRRHKEVTDDLAPRIDPLTRRHKELVDEITAIFQSDREDILGGSKTAVMRSGTLSARFSQGSIEITDEGAAMQYTRAHGKLKAFTKVGKRSFVKANLKKDLKFVDKCPGMTYLQPENLTINLVRNHVEIVTELHPLRRTLS